MHDNEIYEKFNEILMKRNIFLHSQKDVNERKEFLRIVSYCLDNLKDEYRLILYKSYFDNSFKFWWVDDYCKSSFYRKRFWAISSFVHLFEVVYEIFNDFTVCNNSF